ncbi:trace amine-associated receptor 9-like isoform X1 [Clavelina lepadiformis]|uniref:trace amine-associated receptor 9-like isoform X1 n=1 Tax=Clavelina lepadiformis TaxID=159417 RepID=UPI004041CB23
MFNVTTALPVENATYERPFDEIGIAVSAFIILAFLVLGLFGNGLTFAVIVTYRMLSENVFMRFILSLCVSDLISALISWLFLYRRTWGFDVWAPLPDIFCKFYWAADIMTNFVTALHIFSFAVLRLISIQFPVVYNKMKIWHGNIWIAIIWVLSFLCGFLPSWFIFGANERDRLSNSPDARWPACTVIWEQFEFYKLFQEVCYPIFLYLPLVGVVVVCSAIVFIVRIKSRKVAPSKKCEKRQKREKQAVLQLLLIMASFLIGYIPFTAYEFWAVQDLPVTPYYRFADYWFGMIEYFFLRFSECVNPLFYNLGSAKMRRHTKKFIQTKILCCIDWKKGTFSQRGGRSFSATVDRSTTGTNFGV